MRATTSKREVKPAPSSKKQEVVRGEAVVRDILAATLAELAKVGYRALRIEDVATRAGVNKTTVYRRWPQKEELVRAALLSITSDKIGPANTGSLRGDLIALGRAIIAIQTSPEGQSLFQVMLSEGPDSELITIARSLRGHQEQGALAIIKSAEARGELSRRANPLLPCELLGAFLQFKMLSQHIIVSDAELARVVDAILVGVLRPSKRKGVGPPAAST